MLYFKITALIYNNYVVMGKYVAILILRHNFIQVEVFIRACYQLKVSIQATFF